MGARPIQDSGVLTNLNSTGHIGPGHYLPEQVTQLDKWRTASKWEFPRANRGDLYGKKYDKYQTYDTRKATGPQFLSTKRTLPLFTFGRETREGRHKTGMFSSAMTQPPLQMRIQHPSY